MFDLIGFAYVLRVRDSQNCYLQIVRFPINVMNPQFKTLFQEKHGRSLSFFTHAKFKIIQQYSIAFQQYFRFSRICLCFKTSGFSQILLLYISEITQDSTILTCFLGAPCEKTIVLDTRK